MSQQTTNQSLDELAKGLATGTLSRGKAIRWMGGALLGAALASFPGVAWANDCKRLGRECRRDSQCCSKNCIRRGDDKVCACPEGKTRCKDRCVNLKTNERHCGECFNRCDEGEECVRGECGGSPPICPPEEANCCTCVYTSTTDPNRFVSTCHPGVPGVDCEDICANSVPLGTVFDPGSPEDAVSIAFGGVPELTLVCGPTTREQTTGTRCAFVDCTCVDNGGSCTADHSCCSGFCDESGTCCVQGSGPCNTDDDCCGDNICESTGECVAPGPKRIICTCDNGDVIEECREIPCELALEEVCVPACESHGGGGSTSCGAGGSC